MSWMGSAGEPFQDGIATSLVSSKRHRKRPSTQLVPAILQTTITRWGWGRVLTARPSGPASRKRREHAGADERDDASVRRAGRRTGPAGLDGGTRPQPHVNRYFRSPHYPNQKH